MGDVSKGFSRKMVLQLKCEGWIEANKEKRRRMPQQREKVKESLHMCIYVGDGVYIYVCVSTYMWTYVYESVCVCVY